MSHCFWSQLSTEEESTFGAISGILQKKATSVDFANSRLSRKQTESIDREWLRVSSKRGRR